jgi:hypothetical protein
VECHGGAGRGSDAFFLNNLSHFKCQRGLGRRRRWACGASTGLGRGSGSLLRSRSLGC